ncbi:DUF1624 domain-containing protein [Rhodoblastus acidophilus]|uniref:DUF1624 domain-containing protein n=1 Tax=Candidatus Rhodoblastus alkanivorans TaxID=2954117 RepID=A0ABS9Z4U6_9HYPH|nr:DUF1624 domain-containing protein [Candidatus Rhodoblastus alkanivorans]MCI4682654.1 DUF1624 domain-containing protein [Candidatus Rhodoblastus alkanivorans]MDI4639960.1 DUF1624 domain-containing protein [Rhodoblastus acidophilus]
MSAAPRLLWVDIARGVALWAMFAFHFTWDLGHFGWIAPGLLYSESFHWLGHAIASSFLLLVGISLVLSRKARGPLLLSRAFWRRWATITAGAAAISAASFWLFPQSPIFFGILHLIALSSLIAAPLVEAPAWIALSLGVLALAAPTLFAGPFFDAKIFWWTGLGTFEPPSNDYQPLLPWLAMVLFGVALAKFPLPAGGERESGRALPRGLAFFGRHSLTFYLVHQPILFGFMSLLALFVVSPGQERLFVSQCAEQCIREADQPDLCHQTCTCVVSRAKAAGFWPRMVRDALTPEQKTRAHDDVVACFSGQAMSKDAGRPGGK